VMDAGLINIANAVAAWAVVIGLIILISTMWLGRRFCAWICPLGTIQEALFGLRTRQYKLKRKLPFWVEWKFGWVRYVLLLLTVILAALALGWRYMRLCPFLTLSRLPRISWPGLILLIVLIIGSMFTERFWCRFLCPYGALMNVFQKVGEWMGIKRRRMKRNLERCNDCGLCVLYCPMNLNLAEDEYINGADCIHCGLCAEVCPKPGTYSEE